MFRLLVRLIATVVVLIATLALLYAGRLTLATRMGVARTEGTLRGLAVDRPVTIGRDRRGVAHIRAETDHDLWFAQGYAMAADRLFQMDMTRRFVGGRLAEVLGPPLLATDRRMRRYDIAQLAKRVYDAAAPQERAVLEAFADGINAAAQRERTPPEYAALLFDFQPWQAQDAVAVGFATDLDLDDLADTILVRERISRQIGRRNIDAFFPVGDPRYDTPADGSTPGPIATLPPLAGHDASQPAAAVELRADKPPTGSNAWVAGANRTTIGRAILANDPHLSVGVPAIWWLVEARSPHYHIAGATLAGTPGVTLGHDEHVAWGVTSGYGAAMRLLREPFRGDDEVRERGRWLHARHRTERIHVRLRADVDLDVLETDRGVVVAHDGDTAYLMDWAMRRHPVSTLAPFLALDGASSAAEAVAALRRIPEPPLNVVLADDGGLAAYHFTAAVPDDDAWSRYAIDGDRASTTTLPFDSLPHVDPSRDAFAISANSRPAGAAKPRLGPNFAPPYRAFEIRRKLDAAQDAQQRLSPDDLASEQRDATSPAELELAHLVLAALGRRHADDDRTLVPLLAALRSFDGVLGPESRGATAIVAVRRELVSALADATLPAPLAGPFVQVGFGFEVLLRALRERPHGWVPRNDYDGFILGGVRAAQQRLGTEVPAFGTYAAQPLQHPLAALGFRFWNGPTMPGRGGDFAPAVQWNAHAQSFRAVWIAGSWDAGSLDIDAGESGEPGSPHYADQTEGWIHFARTPLPFSDQAVKAATTATLTLTH